MRFFTGRVAVCFCGLLPLAACENNAQTPLPGTPLALEQPCDVGTGCRASNESLAVNVNFGPHARLLQPFPVTVRFDGDSQVDSVTAAFSMKGMDMGWNRYRLNKDAAGLWSADVTLPVCVSGRSDWVVDFDAMAEGRRLQWQIPFVLDK